MDVPTGGPLFRLPRAREGHIERRQFTTAEFRDAFGDTLFRLVPLGGTIDTSYDEMEGERIRVRYVSAYDHDTVVQEIRRGKTDAEKATKTILSTVADVSTNSTGTTASVYIEGDSSGSDRKEHYRDAVSDRRLKILPDKVWQYQGANGWRWHRLNIAQRTPDAALLRDTLSE